MSFLSGQPHPRAYVTLICLVAALGGLLFGYDTAVIAGAIGFLESHFSLSAAEKGWAAACALLGCALGVGVAGAVSDRLGRKPALVLAGLLFLISAIGTALPGSFAGFVLFRVLGGVGVGIASMASPIYIAEVTPADIRGRMVSVNQFAIISGMLIIYFVNYFIARQGDQEWNVTTGWRWMFASGAVPSLLFLGLLALVPESPRFLAVRQRTEEALAVLKRVHSPAAAERELAAIQASVTDEKTGRLRELWQPRLRGILWLGIALAVLQQVTGINVFLYYAPEIFKRLGAGVDAALLQTIVVGAINLLFTIVAIWTVDRWGRRPLMIVGATGMGLSLLAMGLVAQWHGVALGMVLFILAYIACFALSVGPVTWVLLSEIFPTHLRGRGLALAAFCLWSANFVVSQTFPMMDGNAWLVARFNHAFPFYVYGGFCVLLVWVVWRWVPETKGRSLEEIDRSLGRRPPAPGLS